MISLALSSLQLTAYGVPFLCINHWVDRAAVWDEEAIEIVLIMSHLEIN